MKEILSLTFILSIAFTVFSQETVNITLIARNTGEKVLANNDTIRVFGFAESLGDQPGVPGPTLIANEGDSVHIDLWNVSQGAPHTIHLHGLDVDQPNDGVPHLSFDVPHMEHGFYHFKAPHAGTYLYHCHVVSTIHVQAGMYGLIIIKPSDGSNTTWNGGFPYTEEHAYFLSEIDTAWHTDEVLLHDHDTSLAIHLVEIPKFEPQFFLINGFSDQQLIDENVAFNSKVNQTDYVRLANIGYCGTRVIFPPELNAKIVSSDGRPLNNVEVTDTVPLYPGERYGVLTEASMEFQSQIKFEYFDLNTMKIKNTQVVPVDVNGFNNVDELAKNEFSFEVVPNPTTGDLMVKNDQLEQYQVRIYTLTGQMILNEKVTGKIWNANLSNQSNGIYILTVVNENGLVFREKISKI